MGEDKEDIKTEVSSETEAQVTTLEKVTKIVLLNVVCTYNIVSTFQSISANLFHTTQDTIVCVNSHLRNPLSLFMLQGTTPISAVYRSLSIEFLSIGLVWLGYIRKNHILNFKVWFHCRSLQVASWSGLRIPFSLT